MKLYNNELTKYPFIVVKVSYFSEKRSKCVISFRSAVVTSVLTTVFISLQDRRQQFLHPCMALSPE